MASSGSTKLASELVYDSLASADIELLVEVPGHQTIPIDRLLLERDEITTIRARHETAIPHIAWGHYESGGGPVATLTVPGPGDTNAMHGLRNALDDRVPLVHLSADVDPRHRGRGAIHELEPETLDSVVKRNEVVTNPSALPTSLESGIGEALSTPTGPVRFSVPAVYLDEEVDGSGVAVRPEQVSYAPDAAVDRAVELLSSADRPVVYVDNGVRRSPGATEAVRDLVSQLDVPVVSSYKGSGVVPSDDPRFMSTAGLGLLAGARRVLERADVMLALGAYFDGPATSFWTLPTGDRLIHVTVEPAHIDRSYEADVAVVGDVREAVESITARIDGPVGWSGSRIGDAIKAEFQSHLAESGLYEDRSPAPSAALFRELRSVLPDETIVVVDVGNFRPWALASFDVYEPESIVTPGSWTGMGVGVPGAIGAKLANPDRPVVTFIGDGCLLMCLQELHTAAEYGIDVTTVVLNNEDYGIISNEPRLREFAGDRYFGWNSPDFVGLAESFGCLGHRAESPTEAAEAVEATLACDTPALVDVAVDPDEIGPDEAADYESTVALP